MIDLPRQMRNFADAEFITRHTFVVDKWAKEVERLIADLAEAKSENARLREALKGIRDLIEGDVVEQDGFVVGEIVRRALEVTR